VSVSQEWPSVSEVPAMEVPHVEVPLQEVLTGVGPTDEATARGPHWHLANGRGHCAAAPMHIRSR
jgi:hypothetical protein